ncbi:CDP-diacylglycerol--inositol 3-phosphatidyltransferase isoform 1 [Schistosoma japonicum]|uniref:CDP-diacylglycerol--inositol 3-phosphatidyltransferase n=1 Tax=Schistosoma japonicum TaxID=6182 RepID=A0A4Z2D5L9_SCHJA|nr:CDP-diacylglycerol--inositol 3-phosphatidyltransferase isoform 1 [Schistosoma japonicum]
MGVFLFVPNIIGYIRIILLFQACYFMRINCELTLLTYIISCFLDAVDGYAARALNQSTKFGAMLDMIVDRCSTMCLLACLTYFYPSYMLFFQFTMIVDIASHWLHVHSSILSGKSSHKSINLNDNRFLKLYYTNRVILFLMCAGNELFYTLLYVYHFYPGPKGKLLFMFYCFFSSIIFGSHDYTAYTAMQRCWLFFH